MRRTDAGGEGGAAEAEGAGLAGPHGVDGTHSRSLPGPGLSIWGRQEATVSELGRRQQRRGVCRKQGSGGGGRGASHTQQRAEKTGRGRARDVHRRRGSTKETCWGTRQMPHQTSRPPRKPTASQPHPAWSQGWSWGWGLTAFLSLSPRFLLRCQRKLMEEGGGRQWSWAGHPVTQTEAIFIDIHGADSKLSPWQDGPVMGHRSLQPTRPPCHQASQRGDLDIWRREVGLERHVFLCQGPGAVGRPAQGKYKNR